MIEMRERTIPMAEHRTNKPIGIHSGRQLLLLSRVFLPDQYWNMTPLFIFYQSNRDFRGSCASKVIDLQRREKNFHIWRRKESGMKLENISFSLICNPLEDFGSIRERMLRGLVSFENGFFLRRLSPVPSRI